MLGWSSRVDQLRRTHCGPLSLSGVRGLPGVGHVLRPLRPRLLLEVPVGLDPGV